MTLIFVDVEAANGISPANGVMTEFGAVEYHTEQTFHGVLWPSSPSTENPAVSVITGSPLDAYIVMYDFDLWLHQFPAPYVFVSDNNGYDFQWINFVFEKQLGYNPFGHSSRRISDFFAGLNDDWRKTQAWKRYRITPHDHKPVNDAMGNVEAFKRIVQEYNLEIK